MDLFREEERAKPLDDSIEWWVGRRYRLWVACKLAYTGQPPFNWDPSAILFEIAEDKRAEHLPRTKTISMSDFSSLHPPPGEYTVVRVISNFTDSKNREDRWVSLRLLTTVAARHAVVGPEYAYIGGAARLFIDGDLRWSKTFVPPSPFYYGQENHYHSISTGSTSSTGRRRNEA